MVYSGADVARFLGISTSAVNRLAVSDELSEVAKYINRFGTNVPLYTPIQVQSVTKSPFTLSLPKGSLFYPAC